MNAVSFPFLSISAPVWTFSVYYFTVRNYLRKKQNQTARRNGWKASKLVIRIHYFKWTALLVCTTCSSQKTPFRTQYSAQNKTETDRGNSSRPHDIWMDAWRSNLLNFSSFYKISSVSMPFRHVVHTKKDKTQGVRKTRTEQTKWEWRRKSFKAQKSNKIK